MTIELLATVGKTIRRIRKERGLTQEQLAERADCHPNYVGGVERGERNVALLNILYFARALGVRPERLFEDLTDIKLRRLPTKSAKRLRSERSR